MFLRPISNTLSERLEEPRRFIQALIGPRQTGKTTVARQIISGTKIPSHYASADEPVLRDRVWIEQQWEAARFRLKADVTREKGILVLDEVQKVPGWSETVKRLWDEDTADELPLHVVILGSSQLPMQQGLTESHAACFDFVMAYHAGGTLTDRIPTEEQKGGYALKMPLMERHISIFSPDPQCDV